VISLGAYNVLAFMPTLRAVMVAKIAENSTDYSLNNTVRNMLFLPLTYEQKFSAKQAIDSFSCAWAMCYPLCSCFSVRRLSVWILADCR
jgi:hypothetical protein